MAQKINQSFNYRGIIYVSQPNSYYTSVLSTCHYVSFLLFPSLSVQFSSVAQSCQDSLRPFSVATKHQNHYKGRDQSLVLENSAPLLLQIFLLLLPLSPPLMFHYVYTTPFVTGPTILEYWVPFSSFYFSRCTSAWEDSTDMSSGSLILSLSVCWSSLYWWVNQSDLHFWYNVFDFQHFLLILKSFNIPAYITHLFLHVVRFFPLVLLTLLIIVI